MKYNSDLNEGLAKLSNVKLNRRENTKTTAFIICNQSLEK